MRIFNCNIHFYVYRFCLVIIFTLSAKASFAESFSKEYELTLADLTTLSVQTASRQPQKISDVAASISVITSTDIERSGAQSLPELLSMVPGVDVYEVGGNEWAIGIRGAANRLNSKVLVLVDGQNMHNPFYSGTRWGGLLYPLDDIQKIEVIRGPAAIIWGINAVNGVINIITRSAAQVPRELMISGGAKQRSYFRWGHALSNDKSIYARAYFTTQQRSSESLLKSANFGGYKSKAIGGRVDGYRTDGGKWDFSIDVFKTVSRQGYVVSELQSNIFPDEMSSALSLRYHTEFVLDENRHLQLNLAYVHGNDRLKTSFFGQNFNILDVDRNTLDLNLQESFSFRLHDFTWGLTYRHHKDYLGQCSLLCLESNDSQLSFLSGYLEDKYHLTDKTLLTLGFRYDYNPYTRWDSSFNIGVSYMINAENTLWGAYTSTNLIPSRLDTGDGVNVGWVDPADPSKGKLMLKNTNDYENQKIESIEVGLRSSWSDSFSTDIALFYQAYENLKSYRVADANLLTLPNYVTYYLEDTYFDEYSMSGVEVSSNWYLYSNLQLKSAITLNHAHNGDGYEAINQMTMPRYQANMTLFWTPSSVVSLSLALRHNSSSINVSKNTKSSERLSATRIDLSGRWEISRSVELSLIGENIFDNQCSAYQNSGVLLSDISSYNLRICSRRALTGQLHWQF